MWKRWIQSHPICFLIFTILRALFSCLLISLWMKTAKQTGSLVLTVLILNTGFEVLTACYFVYLINEAGENRQHLCNLLIKQKEATQQSEKKSMNKSLAFARASHDIRGYLATLSGLIQLNHHQVSQTSNSLWSEFDTNFQQMEACIRDLLGLLNSILDTSKIEAGKMQLEKGDFAMEELLEEVVDFYHHVGLKKGIDVILDPFDHSIIKHSRVRGDRGKLKQILSNLLSNAVKFTAEGHVLVRASARKPSLHRRNSMEFLFEVDDTGKGIPREKREDVFENYVQVNETTVDQEGTGLGLGIVQSLVRLMGGEIEIVDKELGERGACIRFNIFLETEESNNARGDSPAPSKVEERSRVVLFIQSPKRSLLMQSFMQRLKINVQVVTNHKQFSRALKSIKQELILSSYNTSQNSSASSPWRKKRFVLMVIDSCAGPIQDINTALVEFRRDLQEDCCSRVIWVDFTFPSLDESKLPPSDLVISKPFHGSRLYQTIGLLPEFGGVPPRRGEIHASSQVRKWKRGEVKQVQGTNNTNMPLKGKTILVVDDDSIGRRVAEYIIQQLGGISFLCENGEKACAIVAAKLQAGAATTNIPFSCILMDCEMPVMNGIEATRRIREIEKNCGVRTPIVALTAHQKGLGEEIDEMIQAGADDCLTKPLNKERFLEIISKLPHQPCQNFVS